MERFPPSIPWRERPAHVEGITRSYLTISKDLGAGDESAQGLVSKLGPFPVLGRKFTPRVPLEWLSKITGTWRAPAGRALLPTTRRPAFWPNKPGKSCWPRLRKHRATKLLRQIPGIGSLRAGSLGGVDADAPPLRHPAPTVDLQRACVGDSRRREQSRSIQGQLQRSKKPPQLRGLNANHNHDLKDVFKGAAMRASTCAGPLREFYQNLLAKGMRPTMARLTLARKIAAITLIVWKKGASFDANYLKQAA